jgi:chromate transporter
VRRSETLAVFPPGWLGIVSMLKSAAAATAAIRAFSLLGLFLFFLKLGAMLYGSGYVLLAFLQTDLVDRLHWITQSQLLDVVAIARSLRGRFSPPRPLSATCSAGRAARPSRR